MRIQAIKTTAFLATLFVSAATAQPILEKIEANHRVFFPSGEGRFPTVIAIPGCSGVSLEGPATDQGRPGDDADRLFRRHYARMAERLRDGGLGVVLVDYLTAESVANTCSGEISHERVGEYVAASLEFARSLPQVDPSRLYAVGWSHGGAGVIAWLQALGQGAPPAVAGAVAVYPGCNGRDVWVSPVPVLMLLGEADDITPPESCDRILRRLPDGAEVQVRRYADARHGFDFSEGPEVLSIGGGMTVGRNPSAGEAAWDEIFAFLGAPRRAESASAVPSRMPQTPESLVIEAARLVDVDEAGSRLATIVVQDGRVSWIGAPSDAEVPPGSIRIDGREMWVIPGLIELHSHYTDEPSLRRALALGVTTAHTIADPGTSLELAQRSNDATVPMPRLQLTTALFGEFPEHVQPGRYRVKTPQTAALARRDVAELRLEGASAVKIWQDDGVLWFGEETTFPPIPDAAFREIVRAAHELRMRVYLHAWRRQYAEAAIQSGVDSFIHPVADAVLKDRDFEGMQRQGIPWATTMAVVLVYGEPGDYARRILGDPILRSALTADELAGFEADAKATTHRFHELMPELAARRSDYMEVIKQNTLRARELGVTLALGSDEIVGIGTHIEMELLQEIGLSPLEVLTAATRGSATALGLEAAIGGVGVGKTADLLVLRSDPLADIKNVRDIEWVVKGGHPLRPAALSESPQRARE